MTSMSGKRVRTFSRRSSAVVSRGTGLPVTNSRGERSKVKTAGVIPNSIARSSARRSRAWWPRWTPSKNPKAITFLLLSSMGIVLSSGIQRGRRRPQPPKKFFTDTSIPLWQRLRHRKVPSWP